MFRRIGLGTVTVALWFGLILPALATASEPHEEGSWQERRLLSPSASQRRQETRGQVFIYDGLAYGTIGQAMDRHFDRIENMMFTRIHHLPPTGSGQATVEDDDCD